jgi:MFS family permease
VERAAPESDRTRALVFAAAFLRALATGMIGVLVGIYLSELNLAPGEVGLIVAAGLAGGALATLTATVAGERIGRRRFLLSAALLSAGGAVALSLGSNPAFLAAAAFLGMVNGMGRDRGAALVLEQAILPATATAGDRTRVFAWYNVCQDLGHALGGIAAGLPTLLRAALPIAPIHALRLSVLAYAALMALTLVLYARLSADAVAPGPRAPRFRPSPETTRILWRISSLFALDSLGGGFLTTALVALFFHQRFGAGVGSVGLLFAAARGLNALSHLGAAWLARRIGLVNTMVFTHIPSSLLLVTVAFAPTFPVAAALFLLREGLVEMDVPTRQSYVMAVVRPEERVFASGVTHLVRLGMWAVAPAFAGLFMQGLSLATPLVVGAGMKIAYDVLLYAAFRKVRPPEESASGPG